MQIEIVKPTTVSIPELDMELQFYVSSDGTRSGLSQNALARMCGVSARALFAEGRIINELANSSGTKTAPESLQAIQGKVFLKELKGDNSNFELANIIDSKAAAMIIGYYAYESKAANSIARKSLMAFAAMGMETWIKKITGFNKTESDMSDIKQMLGMLVTKVDTLTEKVDDFGRVITAYLAMNDVQDGLKKALPLPLKEFFTIPEYLEVRSIELTDKQKKQLYLRIAETYKSLVKQQPKKVRRASKGGNNRNSHVWAYRQQDIPLIEQNIKELLGF